MTLVCFSHPKYDGVENPPLSCKTCCSIFISKIKNDNKPANKNETVDPEGWLKKKIEQARNTGAVAKK